MEKKLNKLNNIEFLALAETKLHSYDDDGFSGLSYTNALHIYRSLLRQLVLIIDNTIGDIRHDDITQDSLSKYYVDSVLWVNIDRVDTLLEIGEPIKRGKLSDIELLYKDIMHDMLMMFSLLMKYFSKDTISKIDTSYNNRVIVELLSHEVKLWNESQENIKEKDGYSLDLLTLMVDYTQLINNMLSIIHAIMDMNEFEIGIKKIAKPLSDLDYSVGSYDNYLFAVATPNEIAFDKKFRLAKYFEVVDEIREKNRKIKLKLADNIDKE